MANIRTARRSGFVLRGGAMRRESAWVGIVATRQIVTGPSGAILFGGFSATLLGLRPFTIVRVRGEMHVGSDQEVADENQMIGLGFAVVSDQALAIGITAVPTPMTDLSSDLWFLHDTLTSEFLLGTAVGFSGDFGRGKVFDSKAMRKVEDGQDLAIVAETSSVSNGVVFSKVGRMLIKLH